MKARSAHVLLPVVLLLVISLLPASTIPGNAASRTLEHESVVERNLHVVLAEGEPPLRKSSFVKPPRQSTSSRGQTRANPPATALAKTFASRRQLVLRFARQYVGVRYLYGGTNPRTGLDCSGYVRLVFRQVGIYLPRTSSDQARVGHQVMTTRLALPGDLLFFHRPVSHVAIYAGNGRMYAAPHAGLRVRLQPVYETPSVIRSVLP